MQYKSIDAMAINPLIVILLLDELAEGWPLCCGAPMMAIFSHEMTVVSQQHFQ